MNEIKLTYLKLVDKYGYIIATHILRSELSSRFINCINEVPTAYISAAEQLNEFNKAVYKTLALQISFKYSNYVHKANNSTFINRWYYKIMAEKWRTKVLEIEKEIKDLD